MTLNDLTSLSAPFIVFFLGLLVKQMQRASEKISSIEVSLGIIATKISSHEEKIARLESRKSVSDFNN